MTDTNRYRPVLEPPEPDAKGEKFWHLVAKYRGPKGDMLRRMEGTAINSKNVAEELDVKVNTASNYLRQAEKEELVTCVTPEVTRNKMYKLTDAGKRVLEEL